MLASHGLRPHVPALPAPVPAVRRFPRHRLGDGLRCQVALPALWLCATHQRRFRRRWRATGADEPPAGGPKPVAAPTEEPTVRDEEPPAPAAPVEDPPGQTPPDPEDPPGTVPEPSSEANDNGSNDEIPGKSLDLTEDELDEQIEWEDEPDEGLERIMGLEAFQTIVREPTPPPAFCSESPDRPELPICDMREEILKQVADNRVVTIIGGTGCGKSTQVGPGIPSSAAYMQYPLCTPCLS